MQMSEAVKQSTYSLRQAIGVATLRKALHQDAQSVAALLKDMKVNTKMMENSISPHKGSKIDVRV